MTRVVVSNVQVLTAGTRYDQENAKDGKPIPSTVVTLLVSPDDGERIALAASEGQIMLTLRNPLDTSADHDVGDADHGAVRARRPWPPQRRRAPARVRSGEAGTTRAAGGADAEGVHGGNHSAGPSEVRRLFDEDVESRFEARPARRRRVPGRAAGAAGQPAGIAQQPSSGGGNAAAAVRARRGDGRAIDRGGHRPSTSRASPSPIPRSPTRWSWSRARSSSTARRPARSA